jgi:hypothetical protein
MRHTDHRGRLEVNIQTQECDLPDDQLARIGAPLDRLAQAIGQLPASLELNVVRHPRSDRFHAEAALRLPRRSLFTGDWDAYLDPALQRCLRKLLHKAEAYTHKPDRRADEVAVDVWAMNNEILAPQDPDEGPLGQAAEAGDYGRFRRLLAGYDDWLRLRVGRWLQRYPAANARVGEGLAIGDVVEEVFLNAFERYAERSGHETVRDFLDDLLDPSLHALLNSPAEERENIAIARTLRQTPL